MIYTTLSRKLIVINPETLRYKIIADAGLLNDMTLGLDGSIYYVPDAGTTLSRIAVPETDATLSSITIDGKPLAGFSPGMLKYRAAMSSSSVVQAAATQSGASVSVRFDESTKQTIITVTASDGKSKLDYKIDHLTLESLSLKLDQWIASGDVRNPLTVQLQNNLMQAKDHSNKGQTKQMLKSLDDFLKHLGNAAHQDKVSKRAKDGLGADVQKLIEAYP